MKTPVPFIRRLLSITLAFSCITGAAFGNGLIIIDEPIDIDIHIHPEPPRPHPPIIRPPRPPRPIHRHMPLDLKSQRVDVTIKDQLVTTEVKQIFENPTSRRLEGTFIFPVPRNARVDKFEMDVNGELVEAELLPADKARKIYEDIVRKAQDPALFEYAGRDLFKVRIFPIEPHSKKEVRIQYSELLSKDGNLVRYAYPLNASKYCRKPIDDFAMKVEIEASGGKALKTVYSPSHDVEVSRKGKRRAVLGMEEKNLATDQDFVLYYSLKPTGNDPVSVDFLTFHEDGTDEPGHFLLMLSPNVWEDDAEVEIVPKDVVFVFDTSGSMRGDKLEQAQAAMRFCIESLNPEDRFEVIRFSTEAEPVFEKLVKATDGNQKKALKFIDGVRAIGGTAIQEALSQAVDSAADAAEDGRPTQVIFLTDGKPTLGSTKTDVIVESVESAMGKKSVRVFCFGVGTDINTHLLDLVTEKTKALSQYVLPDEDIEEKVSTFYAKIADPVLADLKLSIEGVEWVRERYPKDLPDLFRGQQLLVLGRYERKKDKGDIVLTGWVNGKKAAFEFPAEFGDGGDEHEFIANLWATRRVGYLLDNIRLQGESDELKEEVAELARKYGIVTPYTTYLIVEDEARRDVPRQLRTQLFQGRTERESDGFSVVRPAAADPFADASQTRGNSIAEESGAAGVASATSTSELKQATGKVSVRRSNEAIARLGGAVRAEIPSQNIQGKTFYYQSTGVWMDGEAQKLDAAKAEKKRTIKFGSDEYFALLSENLQLTQWLSVGPNVQIVIDGELIEITP